MMKFLLTFLLSACLLNQLSAQNLNAGDIAFITINTDSNDAWAWVALVDIPSGQVIYFTDNGYDADALPPLLTNESTVTFTVSSEIPAGTVFNIDKNAADFSPSTFGSVSGSISSMNIGGDNLFAYQGSASTPTFIAGVYINYNSDKYSTTTKWNEAGKNVSANDSELPSALTDGVNAVSLYPGIPEKDNARYTGIRIGTRTELLTAINNFNNWTDAGDSNENYTFTAGDFTVTPAVTTAPEINVQQSSSDINSGGNYAFGTVQIGAHSDVVFTVQNTGDADLNITSITPAGTGFSVQSGLSANPISASGSATFTVRFEPSATSQTSGSVTIASNDADEASYIINFTATVTNAILNITVYLEGPLSGTSMSTAISGDVPKDPNDVYTGVQAEDAVASLPANTVDWVEVEIRTGTSAATKVGTNRAGILKADGSVVDKDGNAFTLSQANGTPYYIVIHHRNHLSVMSKDPVVASSGTYSINFTEAGMSHGTGGDINIGGEYAMIAGDADGDGDVDADDLTTWRAQNGISFSYGSNDKADLNMDGVINAVDRNELQQKNSVTSSQVPSS